MSRLANLTPRRITELLTKNEIQLPSNILPNCVKSIECNQLASNNPIEDRLRVSTVKLPGLTEPTLIMGVFDGHGGGTTADIISRRLFNYIALSLYPKPIDLKISNYKELENIVVDLHSSPQPDQDPELLDDELESLLRFKEEVSKKNNIMDNLRVSFKRCDDDLSEEIKSNLTNPKSSQSTLNYYLSAAVSGCCALVMVLHRGIGYLASVGDCRAVLGTSFMDSNNDKSNQNISQFKNSVPSYNFNTIELNDEHNCDNINEIRRLAAEHPKTEQNTIIKHNRLLGHLMPFRAFGDFNYKWPVETIRSCGIARKFGSGVIPLHYNTPPYLIADPDIKELQIEQDSSQISPTRERYLVIASDGLWDFFGSSREVIETVVDHSVYASQMKEDYDSNCATHILRSALRSSLTHDFSSDSEESKRIYHLRLEALLTLPQAVVRNFRDDISILMLKLK